MSKTGSSPREHCASRYQKHSDGVPRVCGKRLWRTGNGQPQWLERSFYRANTPTPPRALGGN